MTHSPRGRSSFTRWWSIERETNNESSADGSYTLSSPARIDYRKDPSPAAVLVEPVYADLLRTLIHDSKVGPLTSTQTLHTQFTRELMHVPDLAVRLLHLPDLSFGIRILSYTTLKAWEGRSLVGYKKILSDQIPQDLHPSLDAFVSLSNMLKLESTFYEKLESFIVMAKGRLVDPRASSYFLTVEMVFSKNNLPVFRDTREPRGEEKI